MGRIKIKSKTPFGGVAPEPIMVTGAPGFRADMPIPTRIVNFVFMNGGTGDFINYASALLYVMKEYKHVDGRVFAFDPFLNVARHLFTHPRWEVHNRADFSKFYVNGSVICSPVKHDQLITAVGAHLLDLGFMYYCNQQFPPPDYNYLPRINYGGLWKWPDLDSRSDYAIFTPGATADVRAVPAYAFNKLVEHSLKLGVTPVFLGQKRLGTDYAAKFDEGYDLTKGIDLREQTTLLEATQLMKGAKFVVGLDNGLLHMAGTTDVPIIFGHNIAAVEHRRIKRPVGVTKDVFLKREELGCIACQSTQRFTIHYYIKCPYGDKACIDLLFADDCIRWTKAMDEIMTEVWGRK